MRSLAPGWDGSPATAATQRQNCNQRETQNAPRRPWPGVIPTRDGPHGSESASLFGITRPRARAPAHRAPTPPTQAKYRSDWHSLPAHFSLGSAVAPPIPRPPGCRQCRVPAPEENGYGTPVWHSAAKTPELVDPLLLIPPLQFFVLREFISTPPITVSRTA